jgi:hypothetical protein
MNSPDISPDPIDVAVEEDRIEALRKRVNAFIRTVQRRLTFLIIATIVLLAAVIGVGAYALIKANQTHSALCTFRADLQNRVVQTEHYIHHPEDFPGVHIPPSQLVPQLENQKRTISALSSLGCAPVLIPAPDAGILLEERRG